jgi:Rrf2 family iron-sulfur cluster assembly transcriptional regulator
MFNKKLTVAIEALAYISVHSAEKAVSSRDVCEALGLKLRYTETLMQALVKAGILRGVRGAAGGYFIAQDRRKVTLSEVYEIVNKLTKNKKATENKSSYASLVDDINNDIETALEKILGEITLDEIYNKAKKIKVSSGKTNKTDFVI